MKPPARAWPVFVGCVLLVAGALAWVSVDLLRLEVAEKRSHEEADYQASLRLAMWRMDSWVATVVAREAARPAAEYQAYHSLPRAYTTSLVPLPRGGVLVPSPLLAPVSEIFPLHFLLGAYSGWSSPQIPAGPGSVDHAPAAVARRVIFAGLESSMDFDRLDQQLTRTEQRLEQRLERLRQGAGGRDLQVQLEQWQRSRDEFQRRAGCATTANRLDATQDPVPPGPLMPLWLDSPLAPAHGELLFVRRAKLGGEQMLQGFVVDRVRLEQRLLGEITDLFPGARLRPEAGAAETPALLARRLATLPVILEAADPEWAPVAGWTRGRATVALIWFAGVIAALAVGLTLHKSVDLARRRQRFVSTVTHELRTPLTTFQLYSEMLAEGLITDESQRLEYLRTLQVESNRLSSMLQNVLAYSRLEQGRVPRATERLSVEELLGRLTPPLRRRAEAAGMVLRVRDRSVRSSSVAVNVEAVGQILFNLVDNAAKYARDTTDRNIHLDVERQNGRIRLTVWDHGPGVPPGWAGAIFEPFERGLRDPADPVPGVGLGLELSRGLARHMGGDLTLESTAGPGACFRVELPAEA